MVVDQQAAPSQPAQKAPTAVPSQTQANGADPAGAASTGGQTNPLQKALFEKVKRGEVDEFVRMVRESGIDVS